MSYDDLNDRMKYAINKILGMDLDWDIKMGMIEKYLRDRGVDPEDIEQIKSSLQEN